jgi:hypothetical protein
MTRQDASVRGAHVSLRVSSLYEFGEPLNDREHVFETTTDDGHFVFTVIPGDESIMVVTGWRDHGAPRNEGERTERRTRLIWEPWGYGARPFVICWCGKRVSRAFITTNRPAEGMLVCHRCAGARYVSQDSFPEARLEVRSQGLRARLRSNTGPYEPIPEKPPRMHWRTYNRLKDELVIVEDELARLREEEEKTMRTAFEARYPDATTAFSIIDQLNVRNRQAQD